MEQETLGLDLPEDQKIQKKKIKNLVSAIIILAGLFLGSLFVDSVQLMSHSGFSQKNLQKTDIFEATGKTWVAYSEPLVNVNVITDDECPNCDPAEVLVWLRRVLPTINAKKIAYDSVEGKQLISQNSVKTLPALIFSDAIAKTDFYSQAQVLFEQKDKNYKMKTEELGLEPGKYLVLPAIVDGDAILGNKDSNVKVVLFSDFQCPYCKAYFQTLRTTMKQYGDKVLFGFKHLPLDIHPQANDAALASECALEQGKFWEYADKLYADQAQWGNAQDIQKVKSYAQMLGLKTADFNKCLDDKKYQDRIDASVAEGTDFGLAGTPATFINDQFKNGVISVDDLKSVIESELNK